MQCHSPSKWTLFVVLISAADMWGVFLLILIYIYIYIYFILYSVNAYIVLMYIIYIHLNIYVYINFCMIIYMYIYFLHHIILYLKHITCNYVLIVFCKCLFYFANPCK